MHESPPLLTRTSFFVKERVAFLKVGDVYDLLDPVTGQAVGQVREEPEWVWLRVLFNQSIKSMLPSRFVVYDADGVSPAFSLRKRAPFLRTRIEVLDRAGRLVAVLRNKLISVSAMLLIEDAEGRSLGRLAGGAFSWTRAWTDPEGRQVGVMDKKWAGLGKELFTSADNYHLEIAPAFAGQPDRVALLLAACLAYDVIFAEN